MRLGCALFARRAARGLVAVAVSAVALVLASVAPARAAGAETVAIVNANILTLGPAGDLQSGTVVIRDGKIVAVGATADIVPQGARVVDATGKIVTPGLVAAVTPLAVNDVVGFGAAGVGTRNNLVSAAFDVRFSINPDSPQIPEARIEGVTRAIVTPTFVEGAPGADTKLFAGQAAAIHLGSGMDLLVKPHVALVMQAGEEGAQVVGGGRGTQLALLEQALNDTREFVRNRAAYDSGRMRKLLLSTPDLEALVPVVEGREPVLIEVNRAVDIHNILTVAREQRIKVILSGAAEAWRVAGELAAAKVPVIVNADQNEAASFEDLDATYENAAILQRAGVLVAYEPSVARIMFLIRTPRFVAGRTLRYGMSHHDALAAITLNPARIFGLDDRFGSIEVGKEADLVIWSGDPLETTTVAENVFIKGVQQSMSSRSRELRDRYIGTIRAGLQAGARPSTDRR